MDSPKPFFSVEAPSWGTSQASPAKARELFRSASTRWWQLLNERTLARWSVSPRTPGAVVHLAMVSGAQKRWWVDEVGWARPRLN